MTWFFYPPLSHAGYDENFIIKEIVSPDKKYKMPVYFRGGVLFKWDYSFIGVLENLQTGEEKNILWLPPDAFTIEWKDEDTLLVNSSVLQVPEETLDYR